MQIVHIKISRDFEEYETQAYFDVENNLQGALDFIKSVLPKTYKEYTKEELKEIEPSDYNFGLGLGITSSSLCKENGFKYWLNITFPKIQETPETPKAFDGSNWNLLIEQCFLGSPEIPEDFNFKELQEKFEEYRRKMNTSEEFVDSFRIGLKDIEESMKEYRKLATCCEQDDTEIEIQGVKFLFGCNYGH